jgi:hypothetical protein
MEYFLGILVSSIRYIIVTIKTRPTSKLENCGNRLEFASFPVREPESAAERKESQNSPAILAKA